MAARPRANTATLRDLYDTCLGSGHSPSPVGRTDCVSTWTSMRLASVPCRVLLHSLLPTDDACSSSSMSTTVIKLSIFSDSTRKLSALPPELRRNTVILKQLHCCPRLNVRVHSSKVELAAAGVHPVGMISLHASV